MQWKLKIIMMRCVQLNFSAWRITIIDRRIVRTLAVIAFKVVDNLIVDVPSSVSAVVHNCRTACGAVVLTIHIFCTAGLPLRSSFVDKQGSATTSCRNLNDSSCIVTSMIFLQFRWSALHIFLGGGDKRFISSPAVLWLVNLSLWAIRVRRIQLLQGVRIHFGVLCVLLLSSTSGTGDTTGSDDA